MSNSVTVLIMAGGTGGHVFPALAVATALREQNIAVQWLGTAVGIEAKLVPSAGLPLNTIRVEGIRGRGIKNLIIAPFKLLQSLFQAAAVLRAVKPDLVLGFGGFAAGPGGLMARLTGRPLVIHEQNARAGTTNRLLAPIATRCLQAFATGLKHAEQVGNPVRANICALPQPEQRFAERSGALRVLVLGGSLGAQFINELVPQALVLMPVGEWQVRHQCGEKHLQSTLNNYRSHGIEQVEVTAFIDDMAAAYGWADLVVCRAGALTVSEIAVAGVAALFIPFPFAIDDHQTANAQWLANFDAAVVKQQHELTAQSLVGLLRTDFGSRDKLLKMANIARAQALPDAATKVAAICQEVLGE